MSGRSRAPKPDEIGGATPPFDVNRVRADFPILARQTYGRPLVYLDNAATAQKPRVVLDAISRFYLEHNANVHRGVHLLSQEATRDYERAREIIQRHLGAADPAEIIFVRGATEAINLVAWSFGRSRLQAGDEVLISAMEHHSNIVPWQILCQERGARLRVIPMNDRGELILEAFEDLLGPKTKLLALNHVSNGLGTINPVKAMIAKARELGIPVLLDGAQAVPHMAVDVRDLDCDFYAFSGHKAFGPTGLGVLYGRRALLEAMPPYQGGGDMIASVTFEKTTYNVLPYKFEAGTPDIAGAIGLGAALSYVNQIGYDAIHAWESVLLRRAEAKLGDIPGIRLIGTAAEKAAVVSFTVEGVHAHDVGTILDREGVAVRAGHHCVQPVMDFFRVPATTRASFAFYNTLEEVDALGRAVGKVKEIFG